VRWVLGSAARSWSRGHFAALAESILHQQLAGAAARAIHGRFVALSPASAHR